MPADIIQHAFDCSTACTFPLPNTYHCILLQVTVLERTREVGKKILISGGARW